MLDPIAMISLRALAASAVIFLAGCASRPEPRLFGKWRSDKAATLKYIEQNSGLTSEQIAKLAGVYGKLELTFEKGQIHWTMDDWRQTTPYAVVARGSDYCVLTIFNTAIGRQQTLRFDFDEHGVWETSDIKRKGLDKERFLKVR